MKCKVSAIFQELIVYFLIVPSFNVILQISILFITLIQMVFYLSGYDSVTKLREKNAHLKILISVGGEIKTFSDVGADGNRRKHFCYSVQKFLTDFGFDGVDLDWKNTDHPDDHPPHKFVQLMENVLDIQKVDFEFGHNYCEMALGPAITKH